MHFSAVATELTTSPVVGKKLINTAQEMKNSQYARRRTLVFCQHNRISIRTSFVSRIIDVPRSTIALMKMSTEKSDGSKIPNVHTNLTTIKTT